MMIPTSSRFGCGVSLTEMKEVLIHDDKISFRSNTREEMEMVSIIRLQMATKGSQGTSVVLL